MSVNSLITSSGGHPGVRTSRQATWNTHCMGIVCFGLSSRADWRLLPSMGSTKNLEDTTSQVER